MLKCLKFRPEDKAADENKENHDQEGHWQGEQDVAQEVHRLAGYAGVGLEHDERHRLVGHDNAADDAGQGYANDHQGRIFVIGGEAKTFSDDIEDIPADDDRGEHIDEGGADVGCR